MVRIPIVIISLIVLAIASVCFSVPDVDAAEFTCSSGTFTCRDCPGNFAPCPGEGGMYYELDSITTRKCDVQWDLPCGSALPVFNCKAVGVYLEGPCCEAVGIWSQTICCSFT